MKSEYAFQMSTSNLRFGPGATGEVGMDLADMGVKKVMVVTDINLSRSAAVKNVLESLERENISYRRFDRVHIEPTDTSMQEAIEFATLESFDGFVAVGGGSSIDTAKVANLYSCYPPENFLDYVNAPTGKGLPIPGDLKPLFAIPTTAGTGSEVSGNANFELSEIPAKTAISHRRLKPTLGIVDPNNTKTMPPLVAVSSGLDVLTHAIESYTAISYNLRPRPERPLMRPPYQGSNPIADIWALEATRTAAKYLVRSIENPDDDEARGMMSLAASMAGIGFSNAGVSIPHAMSYPVSGMVKDYYPEGYPKDHPMVPHGISVVLTAPAAFRFTAPASPERHMEAAKALGEDVSEARAEDAGELLARSMIHLMKRLGLPNGLSIIGYTEADIPNLVEGTLEQQRLLKLSPRPVGAEELAKMFKDTMVYW